MLTDTRRLTATRYAFRRDTRRMLKLAIPAAVILFISCLLIALAYTNTLPPGLGLLVAIAFFLGVISLIVLIPLLVFFYGYSKGGLWLDEEGVRVHFPAENEQRMDWSEALYAVDEGDEYLALSKGKEGLGHLVSKDRYVRLHLEGMTSEDRAAVKRMLAEHAEIRQPRMFTFATFMNTKGETVARGRLYLFENELLCAENRGERRVFITAPIQKLTRVRVRNPFYVGKLECEAFVISYDKKEYVVMLGYETTIRGGLGTSSRWSVTGNAREWVEALQPVAK
ncbi:MAG TPA: hypothetical protein VKV19_14530 [Ktedonobacteraceae bacterium]|jgi:hypothetical protein|nr:hypothetical protein [Ktedonobacteraceae bacterium]